MDRISLQIKLLYDKMGKAEKRIADWIFENPGKIISLSIVELAEQCDCGEATIVRFAKRLKLNGFQELKFSLAAENGGSPASTHITESDSAFEIYQKVCNDIYLSLEKTKGSLKESLLEEAAEKICKAEKIVIFVIQRRPKKTRLTKCLCDVGRRLFITEITVYDKHRINVAIFKTVYNVRGGGIVKDKVLMSTPF